MHSANPPAEVAIVGAGITGLSVAWHLAQRAIAPVVMYERVGVGSGATGIQPGGVRQQWGSRTTCLMARESYLFYRELADRLAVDHDPRLDACGYMFVAETDAALAGLARNVSLQNELGIPSRVITSAEAADLVPGLNGEAIIGAAYCPEDGYFDRPLAVVSAFEVACRRSGVTLESTGVRRVEPAGSGWRLELTDGRTTETGAVVIATGYDARDLLAPLDISLPIEREPRYLFYSNPVKERLLEPLLVSTDRHFAAKQLADGSVLASDLHAIGNATEDKTAWHRRVRTAISELIPILEYVSLPVLVEGAYDITPDRKPVLGPLDGHPGLWIAAGLNGRGFMLAPAVGRLVADALVTGTPAEPLTDLTPARFLRHELTAENQIV